MVGEDARSGQVAERAAAIYRRGQDADGHFYFEGRPAFDARVFRGDLRIAGRQLNGALILPALDLGGRIVSLRFVVPEEDGGYLPLNLPGGQMAGSVWPVGMVGDFPGVLADTSAIVITDDPRQAVWLRQDLNGAPAGVLVACAFGAGHMLDTAKLFLARDPTLALTITTESRLKRAMTEQLEALGIALTGPANLA